MECIYMEHLTNGTVRIIMDDYRVFVFENEMRAIEFLIG